MLGKVPSLVLKKYGNEVTDRCIQHRDSTVQEAAARAFASVSQLILCDDIVNR